MKSLGVTGIWINPFFKSPFHDGGYDISDYFKVAPRYGTNEDAKKMFAVFHSYLIAPIILYISFCLLVIISFKQQRGNHYEIKLVNVPN